MQLRKYIILAVCTFGVGFVYTQSGLRLETCLEAAATHQPLAAQRPLIESAHQEAMQLLKKQNWLQTNLGAQSTWQSEVTHFPLSLPGIEVPQVSKDQYRFTLDLIQPIYDGGLNKSQMQLQQAQTQVEQARLQADLYTANEQIIQLYTALLLADKQIAILNATRLDLQARKTRIEEQLRSGTSIEAQVQMVQVRILELEQQTDELKSRQAAARFGLSLLTGLQIAENEQLSVPYVSENQIATSTIQRPELALFSAQKQAILSQTQLLTSRQRPRVNAIGTLGYARPGLNMLSNDFSPYAIVGLNLKWNLSSFYTGSIKHERNQINLQSQRIEAQQKQFLTLTQVRATQQEQEIARLRAIAKKDGEIIALRKSIVQTSLLQLETGVITETDYLTELTAQTNVELTAALHQIQMVQAVWQYKNINGNLK